MVIGQMRVDRDDVRRFLIIAAGLCVAAAVATIMAPDAGGPIVIALVGILSLIVLLTVFWRAWRWFVGESFDLIEERSRELRDRRDGTKPPRR